MNLSFKYKLTSILFIVGVSAFSQQIENAKSLTSFTDRLSENKSVTNILFLGDSHIQSGWIPEVLRKRFQEKYGNAGRGLVFPYTIANSNGPQDFTSVSNQAWITFRSVYDQDVFKEMGVLGFVMGNNKDSFVEISFKDPKDSFDEVKIYGSEEMKGEDFTIYNSELSLSSFIEKRKNIINYTVQEGETYPELAAKFNTITTRLLQLNGASVKTPKAGQNIKVEEVSVNYNPDFEKQIKITGAGKFEGDESVFQFPEPSQYLLIRSNASKGNIFYGFQFLKKNMNNGIIFNGVGINGATYADYLKYPIQIKELKNTHPDLLIVSLGTNEALSSITKEEFQNNIKNLIDAFRKNDSLLPVLLISPTDNNLKNSKTKDIVLWIKEAADLYNVAFLDQYEATGGKGYFQKSLNRKVANADGVHFLKDGYLEQGDLIWKAFENSKIVDK